MKLPSLKHVFHESTHTFKRFPFVLLSAALGSIVAILLVARDRHEPQGVLHNLLSTAALGLPLFTALTVVAEKQKWRRPANILLQLAGAGVLALYSGVLFLGLAIALLAVENLFEVNIKGERYGQLWVLIAGLFNTWFFLAGVPEHLEALEHETHYPKGLKIFTQYILLPLVVIYLAILYAYEAKIMLAWSWPKGWVANLVLGFAVTGILSLLLVYPIQQQEENRWIRIFSKWYYVALIPLVIMLLLAIGRRISDYGVTENRYFVLAMGLALAGIVLYFVFSPAQNLKIIPIVLCVLAFFSAFGPWGAFRVSANSQVQRLRAVLAKNEILMQGKIQKA